MLLSDVVLTGEVDTDGSKTVTVDLKTVTIEMTHAVESTREREVVRCQSVEVVEIIKPLSTEEVECGMLVLVDMGDSVLVESLGSVLSTEDVRLGNPSEVEMLEENELIDFVGKTVTMIQGGSESVSLVDDEPFRDTLMMLAWPT